MLLTKVDGGIMVGRVDPEAYNLIRRIEDKIRAQYAEADFDLLCGPDDALHLKVYTNDENLWGPLELVEDDLLELQETGNLNLHVIPLNFADREGSSDIPNSDIPELLRRDVQDAEGTTPSFMRNVDSR